MKQLYVLGGAAFLLVLLSNKKPMPKTPPTPPRNGIKVDERLTPLKVDQAFNALKEAYYSLTNSEANLETLAMGLAQTALETGRFKAIHNYNFGNITASSKYEGGWTSYPGDTTHYYRAYTSVFDGAQDYWKLLKNNYGEALAAFATGNPSLAAKKLKERGYFEADLDKYAKALSSLYNEYKKILSETGNS